MACCVLTAFVMNRLIHVCDTFDFRFLQIKYNDDEGDACAPAELAEEKSTSETCRISIDGMTCSACTSSITSHLERIEGVFRASVSLALGRATVSYDTVLTTPKEMVAAIQDAGYDADLGAKSVDETIDRLRQFYELHDLKAAVSSASVCSMLIMGLEYMPALSLNGRSSPKVRYILACLVLLLAIRVQIWDGRSIHMRAWIRRGKQRANMDTLLSLSLLLGLGLAVLQLVVGSSENMQSHASSGSFLTIVILAGKYLEAILKRESNSNLAALYELQTEKETYRLTGTNVSYPLVAMHRSLMNSDDRFSITAEERRRHSPQSSGHRSLRRLRHHRMLRSQRINHHRRKLTSHQRRRRFPAGWNKKPISTAENHSQPRSKRVVPCESDRRRVDCYRTASRGSGVFRCGHEIFRVRCHILGCCIIRSHAVSTPRLVSNRVLYNSVRKSYDSFGRCVSVWNRTCNTVRCYGWNR